MDSIVNFDSSVYFLGKLCSNGHSHQGLEQSLRYANSRHRLCVECKKARDKRYFASEKGRANCDKNAKKYRATTKGRETKQKWKQEWKQTDRGIASEQRYRRSQKRREVLNRYRKSSLGIENARLVASRRRAQIRTSHRVKYLASELREKLGSFDSKCVYCCCSVDLKSVRWDHFIAISKGGADCLGNLVSSCDACNRSKWANDPEKWFFTQPFSTKKQWKFILSKVNQKGGGKYQVPLF